MRKYLTKTGFLYLILFTVIFLPSCEDFLDPQQELAITEEQLYGDWYEYRAVEMGMYGFQQELVEQLVVLGELRADLLTVTDNADADLVEINNFAISGSNKYASPTNFFKLINSANNFLRMLELNHPEVLDPEEPINNYDRLYGEALCMRAWAYFNAVRIYGKVPMIPQSLATMEEIVDYVNQGGTYIDSVYVVYGIDGFTNDTTPNKPIELEKNLYDTKMVIDYFTNELEKKVKAVGVNHSIDIDDATWEVTIWNEFARRALLGQMYLTDGDYANARRHFWEIIKIRDTEEPRYVLDETFARLDWQNIFLSVELQEHIYTIQFSKQNFQQHNFQNLFESWGPYEHKLQPTKAAVENWESVFQNQTIDASSPDPARHRMINRLQIGLSDRYRGYGVSYLYHHPLEGALSPMRFSNMLAYRYLGDLPSSRDLLMGYDTVVTKYSIGKTLYDEDANFMIYRAAGIHLYMAELYTYWRYASGSSVKSEILTAVGYLNDGSQYNQSAAREQVGVRGRVGIGMFRNAADQLVSQPTDKITISDIIYEHDPYTNEIIGYRDLRGNLLAKQQWFEEQILEEKAREMAWEGERFYDLMRVAKRRDDPSFLAEKVASKFTGAQRDQIYNLLLDENNWYINYFE